MGGPSISQGVHIFRYISEKLVPGGPYYTEKLVSGVRFRVGATLVACFVASIHGNGTERLVSHHSVVNPN